MIINLSLYEFQQFYVILQKTGAALGSVKSALDAAIAALPKVSGGDVALSRESNEALQKAVDYSKKNGDEYVSVEAMLMGILQTRCKASQILKDAGLTEKDLQAAIQELRKGNKVKDQSAEETYQPRFLPAPPRTIPCWWANRVPVRRPSPRVWPCA